MLTVKDGESRADWMGRCIPELIDKEGMDQDQAIAACASMWNRSRD